jgi:Fe-S-cluster containining protein
MRDELWLTCDRKTCCHVPIVIPSGRDVWRIARAFDVPPWTFLKYFLSPEPRPDGFKLDHTDRQFRLALAKQPQSELKVPPCIFLLKTRRGAHRCGLGELRPGVCQTFPYELTDGVLTALDNGGCTCRRWSVADADVTPMTARLERCQAEAREYHAVVARWNAQVNGATEERFHFGEFCTFLLAEYDHQPESA